MEMKKISKIILALGVTATLAACGSSESSSSSGESSGSGSSSSSGGSFSGAINVVSREEGSGTRDAFTSITKVAEDDTDNTTPSAIIQNSTDAVLSYVAGDEYSIGYVSLGSLNDSVKALNVDGVEPTEANVSSDSYKMARPFNIVYKGELEGAAKDFRDYIMSQEGQEIISENDYVPVDSDAEPYSGDGSASGSINISGSTSVGPLMEKLAEEYKKLNPNVEINITQNGSGAGVKAAQDGTSDIGMASRALKENESDVTGETIAKDGIAVIVNKSNPTEDLTTEQIHDIFVGDTTDWSEVGE